MKQARRSPITPKQHIPARIEHLTLPQDKRILVVSDIHGNLRYLKGLLEKAQFCDDDILIIAGDLLEKGPRSLDTLRYVISLSAHAEVHMVSGNCDWWVPIMNGVGTVEENLWYLNNKPYCLARQMCEELGIAVTPEMDYIAMRETIMAAYKTEFDFLAALPEVIETEHYTFVHGGLPEGKPETWDAWKCMKYDHFMDTERCFDKWVIVGHWPVMLYHECIVDANPIFDYEKKIISIDGGCFLKDDGQLNALIIPYAGSEDFSVISYDPFPRARVRSAQAGGEKSYYIRWGDAEVELLRRGAEFSRIRHRRTGYEMDVLTKYLRISGDAYVTNDCTDYVLPLRAGDEIAIVETTSRGYFAKKDGISGWYYGEIE